MNEYQRELYELTESAGLISELLQELVDRVDPQNLIYEVDGFAYCPNCGKEFEYAVGDWGCNYCCDCGQALDWSDDQ